MLFHVGRFKFLIFLVLSACGSVGANNITRVDAVTKVWSEGRHDARIIAGPKFYWADDSQLLLYIGRSGPVFWPGELQYSERANDPELLVGAEFSTPLWYSNGK